MATQSARVTMNAPKHRPPASPTTELVADEEAGRAPAPKATAKSDVVTDARGRKLKLRELSLLNEVDLLASMPPAHAAQPMVLGRAMLAARVEWIDDEPIAIPVNAIQYRSMMQTVGREGIAAVIGATMMASDEGEPGQNTETELAKN